MQTLVAVVAALATAVILTISPVDVWGDETINLGNVVTLKDRAFLKVVQLPPPADFPPPLDFTVQGLPADMFVQIFGRNVQIDGTPKKTGNFNATIKVTSSPQPGVPAKTIEIKAQIRVRQGSFTGSASRIGGTSAQVAVSATVPIDGPINLTQSTVTINNLLGELKLGGGGELAAGVPVRLVARRGSRPDEAIFESPPGVNPLFRVQLQTRGGDVLEVTLRINSRNGAVAVPKLCAGKPLVTNLATSFRIVDDGNPPVEFTTGPAWRCLDLAGGKPQSLRVP